MLGVRKLAFQNRKSAVMITLNQSQNYGKRFTTLVELQKVDISWYVIFAHEKNRCRLVTLSTQSTNLQPKEKLFGEFVECIETFPKAL